MKGPTLVLGDANPLYVLDISRYTMNFDDITDSSHTYSWQRFGTFVRTLGHRPLEYSRSLHIKGPKLCQV